MKYEITPYIQQVIDDMKDGWILTYDIDARPFPIAALHKKKEVKEITNWAMGVLWDNGLLKISCKKTYKLK